MTMIQKDHTKDDLQERRDLVRSHNEACMFLHKIAVM
jgi:hypothetical protein